MEFLGWHYIKMANEAIVKLLDSNL